MGICGSKIERQEMVSRCRARKRYMKQLVQSRHFLSFSQSLYLRALRSTGSALLQFANGESSLHRTNIVKQSQQQRPEQQLPLPPTPPPPPSMSPSTDTWTTTTSNTTNTTALAPPPPPPPPGVGSTWDFWDPFVPGMRSGTEEEEWEDEEVATTTTATTTVADTTVTATPTAVRAAASVAAPPSVVSGFSKESDLAVVVSRQGKELVEIIKELDEYFLRAADAGGFVNGVLEVPSNHPEKMYGNGRGLNWSPMMWGSNGKVNGFGFGFGKMGEDMVFRGNGMGMGMGMGNGGVNGGRSSHCSTVERIYAWEKKLFQEVKNAEKLKLEHEKRVEQLRKLEVKRAKNYMKVEKSKKEVEKLESLMEVASQAIGTTSDEIIKLRETELYPQLLDLVKGFTCMWRSMYECHQVQMHIVDQLKFLNVIPSLEPTCEIHRQSTLQLETELQQWHQSFINLVKAQRDYIHSLTGWLRLSLFQFNKNPLVRSVQDSTIYSLCEEWQVAIGNVPDKVASEGIKSLLTVIHAIVIQQGEEHKQKKKSEGANKELEKKASELRTLETKYGPYSMPDSGTRNGKDPVGEKRAKVEMLKSKAEEEKAKHEKAVSVTRAMTLNNLQMGLPHVFQAITGFSDVCRHCFERVANQTKNMDQEHDVKRLMMA